MYFLLNIVRDKECMFEWSEKTVFSVYQSFSANQVMGKIQILPVYIMEIFKDHVYTCFNLDKLW